MINTQHLSPYAEALAAELAEDEAYRVLRRVPDPYHDMPHNGPAPDGTCIALVDVETTGLDPDTDTIIELAILLCFVSESGEVIGHSVPFSWLQDPGDVLDPRISMLTGIGAQHLVGQQIDDVFARGLLDRADLIVAHNAKFDAAFIERRYPDLAGKPWACSCSELDWLKLGFDGRSQSSLLAQVGWFSDAHRAAADVWSLLWLLQHRKLDRQESAARTYLSRLIEASERASVMVQAEGAPYGKKELLRTRGYCWNAEQRFWQIELPPERVEHEQAWAYRNGLPAMTTRVISARERHR